MSGIQTNTKKRITRQTGCHLSKGTETTSANPIVSASTSATQVGSFQARLEESIHTRRETEPDNTFLRHPIPGRIYEAAPQNKDFHMGS